MEPSPPGGLDVSTAGRADASSEDLRDASRPAAGDTCAWCREPIPDGRRKDSITCSRRCRQARWRFRQEVERLELAERALRLAVADPPYPGLAHLYRDHPDFAGEVDHASLLQELDGFDGWALCTSSEALPSVLPLCPNPAQVRIAAWVRGSRSGRARGPLSSWEPVIYKPARDVVSTRQPDDSLVYTARPRLTHPGWVIGAKPAAFASWVFSLLGARSGDELHDLFPGSGGIARAWRAATEAC